MKTPMLGSLLLGLLPLLSCAHPNPPVVQKESPLGRSEPTPERVDPHAGHHGGTHGGYGGSGAVQGWKLDELPVGALLLPNLGAHRREVTSQSPDAQRFFNQGLQLTYAFNHDEAARSYAKAAQLDPSCAMCFWGASLTLGPNYNMPMLPDRARAAWDALQRAQRAARAASPVEQALIRALATRYPGPEPVDAAAMQPFTVRYAEAMREVAAQYPHDLDVQVLAAEAGMNVNAWKLWTLDGDPVPGTLDIVARLESVLERNPNHPGANHYYIHVVEASRTPERALPSADRLASLIPGAGHIVHMPAHIYQRVGRYADASRHNRLATEVDREYIRLAKPAGYYPFYLGHNLGFLAFSSSMEGRRAESVRAARESVQSLPRDLVCAMPGMDYFTALPYFVAIRFGLWEELLREERPDPKYPVLTGLWLHGRGMALASTGRLHEARTMATELAAHTRSIPGDMVADLTVAQELLDVSHRVLMARIAERAKDENAIALWREAVAYADRLPYSEPADWFYPVRHYLGAALLSKGSASEAERVYREDLRRNPKNGWALFGLTQALRKQNKQQDAEESEREFREAWRNADIELTSSAY